MHAPALQVAPPEGQSAVVLQPMAPAVIPSHTVSEHAFCTRNGRSPAGHVGALPELPLDELPELDEPPLLDELPVLDVLLVVDALLVLPVLPALPPAPPALACEPDPPHAPMAPRITTARYQPPSRGMRAVTRGSRGGAAS